MPENDHAHPPRQLTGDDFRPNPPTAFVELGVTSCFSFLYGASDAVDLSRTASQLGYHALGIADLNTMAGIVRLHAAARKACLRPIIGCRLKLMTGE